MELTPEEIIKRLDSPCPDDGKPIYMCPRCVRQLRDELKAQLAKEACPDCVKGKQVYYLKDGYHYYDCPTCQGKRTEEVE